MISSDENSFAGLSGLPLYGNPNVYHYFKFFFVLIFSPLSRCLLMLGNRHDPNAIIAALKELICSINSYYTINHKAYVSDTCTLS